MKIAKGGKKSLKASFRAPRTIFKLTKEQKKEITRIKAWEKASSERNITLGGAIEL